MEVLEKIDGWRMLLAEKTRFGSSLKMEVSLSLSRRLGAEGV